MQAKVCGTGHSWSKARGLAIAYVAHLILPFLLLLDEVMSPHLSPFKVFRHPSDNIVTAAAFVWLVVGVGILLLRRTLPQFLELMRKPLISFYAVLAMLVFCELFARVVWKNPHSYPGVWIPGTKLVSHADPRYEPGVQGVKRFTVNEIGLRGPSVPHSGNPYRIVTVGGSTTECAALDDSEEWPHLLMQGTNLRQSKRPVWVGNAGVSGHTTVHHLVLLKSLPIFSEADLVIFLTGANDLTATVAAAGAPTQRELELNAAFTAAGTWGGPLRYPYFKRLRLWELLKTGIPNALERLTRARRLNFGDDPELYEEVRRARARAPAVALPDLRTGLAEYRQRVGQLARQCKVHRARCLFLTQPNMSRPDLPLAEQRLLWGGWVGPPPSVAYGRLSVHSEAYIDLADEARAFDAYNSTLLDVCRVNGLECYDLASRVPKDTSAFYDDVHFNEGGARIVARLLEDYLVSTAPFAQTLVSSR